MQEFININGLTPCPTRWAAGTGLFRSTASGGSKEGTAWLTGKADKKCNEQRLAEAKILTMLEDLGGKARAAGMSAKKRKEIAKMAAKSRWKRN